MPSWFFIALGASLLWGISNHVDKYLVSRYFQSSGTGAMLIFSALIGIVLLPVILIIQPDVFSIGAGNAWLIVGNGAFYLLALVPYFYAIKHDDVSTVIPIFQIIPVLNYVLAWLLLGEKLSEQQIIAGALIMAGALGISMRFRAGRISIQRTTLGLMIVSSVIFSLAWIIFKRVALVEDFLTTSFWQYIGYVLMGLTLLVFVPRYRYQFLGVLRLNRGPVLAWNTVNEIINIIAVVMFSYAIILGPVALVSVVNGFQPLFVLTIGVLLTLFFPQVSRENIERPTIVQKIIFILIMLTGTYFLNRAA